MGETLGVVLLFPLFIVALIVGGGLAVAFIWWFWKKIGFIDFMTGD